MKTAGLIGGGIVAFVLLVAALFALGVAITAVVVALVWNVLNLHEMFNAEALSFWEVVAVSAGINVVYNILKGIFGGGN